MGVYHYMCGCRPLTVWSRTPRYRDPQHVSKLLNAPRILHQQSKQLFLRTGYHGYGYRYTGHGHIYFRQSVHLQRRSILPTACSLCTSVSGHRPNTSSASGQYMLDVVIPQMLLSPSDPDNLANTISQLVDAHYNSLTNTHPWMQLNNNIAYIQFIVNRNLSEMLKPITDHPNFGLLCDYTSNNYHDMDGLQVSNTLLSMLYLGVDPTHPLITQLLIAARSKISTASLAMLATMSRISRVLMPGMDTITIRSVCQRVAKLCENEEHIGSWTSEDFNGLCQTYINYLSFLSKDFTERALDILLIHVEDPIMLEDPDHIGSCIRMAQKAQLLAKANNSEYKIERVIEKTSEACLKHMDKMKPHNIAEICHALQRSQYYGPDLGRAFQNRAVDLLKDNSPIRDVSNLFYSLQHHKNIDVKAKFTPALFTRLLDGNVDVLILSNIADNLRNIGYVDRDLLQVYQKLVADNANNVIRYISCYNKVAKLLTKKKFIDPDDEVRFSDTLLEHLNQQHGFDLYTLSAVATFILPSSRHVLPEVFFKKLKNAIPRWKGAGIFRLALALNSIKHPISATMRHQVETIQCLLHSNLIERLDDYHMYNQDYGEYVYLFQLTLGLVIHNKNRDPSLTEKIMTMYVPFSANLTDVNMYRTAQIFQSLKYYLPQVYDNLANYVIQNWRQLDSHKISAVLNALGQVGQQPRELDKFLLACLDAFNNLRSSSNYSEMLSILNNLVHLQCLPEEELSQLFTLESIEAIDSYITAQQASKHQLMRQVMTLNRAVVLECPQLDVPWFHEEYCLENFVQAEPSRNPSITHYKEEIEEALKEVLGGRKFLRRWVYSPYFYTIDFECILDENQCPVNVKEVTEKGIKPEWQRVAILTLLETHYCHNSRELDGPTQTKIRHLEMMGYTVVQVPHFDWYSMGLSDCQAKEDYIQSKIFE